MPKEKYLIECKLPDWDLYGGYGKPHEILARTLEEAETEARQLVETNKKCGQEASRKIRISKVVKEMEFDEKGNEKKEEGNE